MTAPTALLTLDEAQHLLGTTAIALVDVWTSSPQGLARTLNGLREPTKLPPSARNAVRAWRDARHQVVAIGLGWLIDDQIEGALSYAGIDLARTEVKIAA